MIKKYDFGKATLVVAIPDPWIDVQTIADLEEIAFEFRDKKKKRLRVATKYPNLTREFLFSKGVTQFKLVDSLGATEAYPFTGSSEIIKASGCQLWSRIQRELPMRTCQIQNQCP